MWFSGFFYYHSWSVPVMKITDLSHLFKWENLYNWWLTKYFFAPLYNMYMIWSEYVNSGHVYHVVFVTWRSSASWLTTKECIGAPQGVVPSPLPYEFSLIQLEPKTLSTLQHASLFKGITVGYSTVQRQPILSFFSSLLGHNDSSTTRTLYGVCVCLCVCAHKAPQGCGWCLRWIEES